MATYNFTIRASDTAGAFADQNFSIEVQRTRIDRFVATTSSGIIRSADGKTWFAEAAPAMTSVSYGNGQWVGVVTNTGNAVTICTSTDAVNWRIGAVQALPKPTGQTGNVFLSQIKWRNGRWMGFGYGVSPSQIIEYSSTDLVTWTVVGTFAPPNVSNCVIMEFEYDATTQTTVVQVEAQAINGNYPLGSGLYTRVGTGAFTLTCPFGQYQGNEGFLQFRNGLWMSHNLSQMIYLSRDGVNWFSRIPVGSGSIINGLSFNNGTLIATGSTGSAISQDGGITWSPRGGTTTNSYRQTNASYGGVTVLVLSSNNQMYYSTNNLNSINATTTGPVALLAGTPRAIATRQD